MIKSQSIASYIIVVKSTYVHKKRERWSQIDFHFMTDESDLDDDSVAQHKLPWRSESKFLKYMYCIALIFW